MARRKTPIEDIFRMTVGLYEIFLLIRLAEKYFTDNRIEETARRNRIWQGSGYKPVRKGDDLRAIINLAKILTENTPVAA